jgi:hypothetical protein
MSNRSIILVFLFLPGIVIAQRSLRLTMGASLGFVNYENRLPDYTERLYRDVRIGRVTGLTLHGIDRGLYSASATLQHQQGGGHLSAKDKDTGLLVGNSPDILRVDYLSLGGQLHLNPLRGKNKLQLGVGPRADLLLSSKKPPLGWIGQEYIRRFNVGITASAGYYRTIGRSELGLCVQHLSRLRKFVNAPPLPNGGGAGVIGVVATDQALLINLSYGIILGE